MLMSKTVNRFLGLQVAFRKLDLVDLKWPDRTIHKKDVSLITLCPISGKLAIDDI